METFILRNKYIYKINTAWLNALQHRRTLSTAGNTSVSKSTKNLKTAKLSLKVTGFSVKKNSFLIEEQFHFINVELHYNHN